MDGDKLDEPATANAAHRQNQNPLSTFFGSAGKAKLSSEGMPRKPTTELNAMEKAKLQGHYVRIVSSIFLPYETDCTCSRVLGYASRVLSSLDTSRVPLFHPQLATLTGFY